MPLEIERRFLVAKDMGPLCQAGTPIIQGYLDSHDDITVRVRIAGGKAFFTVKGRRTGCTRVEHETNLPIIVARRILARLPARRIVRKTRYRVDHAGAEWEVDRFEGRLSGLVIAEIELSYPDEPVVLPDWIGPEITSDRRYGNSRLSCGSLAELVLAA